MSPPSSAPPAPRVLVLSLFLFSGVSGLVYEVVWSRMFATVLGTTAYAVATVLATFMAGLALGSFWFGRQIDRRGWDGLRLYGWLEVGIAAYALLLPFLVDLSDVLFRALWPAVEGGFAGQMALRVLLAAVVLIVPSTLMGGTLPALSRYLVREGDTGRQIGLLYAVNTLGAVAGVLLAGFFLLEALGVRGALAVGAAMSGAVGALALWRARGAPGSRPAPPDEVAVAADAHDQGVRRLALWVFAFSGFAALALEVLWTRSLTYFVSVDTWAFSAMLAAFLTGIGLGSLVMAPWAPRVRRPLVVLGVLQCLVGLTAAASVPLFGVLYSVLESTGGAASAQATLGGRLVQKLACAFAIMLVPTLLMGASFPLFSQVYVGARRVGGSLGTLYALNTVGAIFGSLAAGFAILSTLGLQQGILLVSGLYLLGGGVLLGVRSGRSRALILLGAAGIGTALFFVVPTGPVIEQGFYFQEGSRHRLLYVDEGPAASLAVIDEGEGTTRLLTINGIVTAADNYMDMQVHRMLSHLPMLLHPEPESVLVVGFGMGSTVYGCAQHDVPGVDLVELLRAELGTAPYFEHVNHDILADEERIHFIEGDGRNYLLGTSKKYDVISFNAIHPRYSVNLYTRDFYDLCRDRLTEDGVLCAWLTQNSMEEAEWRGLCGSLVAAFPHASLWYSNPEHYCLVVSMKPQKLDFADWRARMARPGVAADLAASNLDDPFVLAARYVFGTEALKAYVAGATVITDDRPWIEFSLEKQGFEYDIAATMITGKESATAVFALDDADRGRLLDYEKSTAWMMRGQNEFWYRAQQPLVDEVLFRRAVIAAPDNQDARHNLAFSDLSIDMARAAAARRAELGPRLRLARQLREQGQLEAARSELMRLRSEFPKATRIVLELGLVQYLAEDWAACIASLTKLGVPSKDNPEDFALVAYALGGALRRTGDEERGARLQKLAMDTAPAVAEWFSVLEGQVRLLGR